MDGVTLFDRINPARRCDWAWRRAVDVAARKRAPRWLRHQNPIIVRTVQLLRAEAAGTLCQRLDEQFADIRAARRLWQLRGPAELAIQSWLLAREPISAVAARLQQPVEVIATYEQLFFNVTDRLEARDWILNYAIGLRADEPNPQQAALLGKFAYCGGPHLLPEVLPHLLHGFNFNAMQPDVRTAETRRSHRLRLLIYFLLLPDNVQTQQKIALLLRHRTFGGRRDEQPPVAPAQTDVAASSGTSPETPDYGTSPDHEAEVAQPVGHRPPRRKTG